MQHQPKKAKAVGHVYVGVVDGVAVMMEAVGKAVVIVLIMDVHQIMIADVNQLDVKN